MSLKRAAKTICDMGKWRVSNLALQKLLYLSHMTHLGATGDSLVGEAHPFQAWDLGPVQPELYHAAKAYGAAPVPNMFSAPTYREGEPEYDSIQYVMGELGHVSPGRLVAITHWNEGAWAKNYRQGVRGIEIPDEDILDEYRKRVR